MLIRMILAVLCLALCSCASTSKSERSPAVGDGLRIELVKAYLRKGADVAALPLLAQAVAKHPRDVKLRVRYAEVLRDQRALRLAAHEFRVALRLDKRYAAAHAGLGLVLNLQGHHEDAIREHRRAVELEPKNARYWNNLGFSYYIAGRAEEAIRALDRALVLDPTLIVAANNRGFAHASRGDYAAAQRSFRVAVDEEGAALNLKMAWTDARRGRSNPRVQGTRTTRQGESR